MTPLQRGPGPGRGAGRAARGALTYRHRERSAGDSGAAAVHPLAPVNAARAGGEAKPRGVRVGEGFGFFSSGKRPLTAGRAVGGAPGPRAVPNCGGAPSPRSFIRPLLASFPRVLTKGPRPVSPGPGQLAPRGASALPQPRLPPAPAAPRTAIGTAPSRPTAQWGRGGSAPQVRGSQWEASRGSRPPAAAAAT